MESSCFFFFTSYNGFNTFPSFVLLSFTLSQLYPRFIQGCSRNGLDVVISRPAARPTFPYRRMSSSPLKSAFRHSRLLPIHEFCVKNRKCPSLVYMRPSSTVARPQVTFTWDEQEEAFLESAETEKRVPTRSARPHSPLYSVQRQIAAEGEWLQDDADVDASEGSTTRFDWRGRATSRRRKVEGASIEVKRFRKRVRPPLLSLLGDKNDTTFLAIERYSNK